MVSVEVWGGGTLCPHFPRMIAKKCMHALARSTCIFCMRQNNPCMLLLPPSPTPPLCVNSPTHLRYENTERRKAMVAEKGLLYLGMGVSGGEEGARNGERGNVGRWVPGLRVMRGEGGHGTSQPGSGGGILC